MEDTMVKVSAEDCVQVGNEIIFICREFNMICALDLDNGDIRIIGSLPEESLFAERLGSKIIYWRDELIFIPMNAKKIWRYNIKTGEWRGYERKDLGDRWSKGYMIQAIVQQDKLFIIGGDYPAIIILNLENDEMLYVEGPFEVLQQKRIELIDDYFRTNYVRKDDVIYLTTALDNKVLSFNLNTLEYKWFEVGNKGSGYSGIAWDGENFWLAPKKGMNAIVWKEDKEAIEYNLSSESCMFIGVVCKDDEIVFPGIGSTQTYIWQKSRCNKENKQYYFYNKINSEKLVSISIENEIFICNENETKIYNLQMKKKYVNEYLLQNIICEDLINSIMYEKYAFDLKSYLKVIK